ncbi:MAG TPA: hypothetical protein VGW34_10605 [Allosphingosinicella sp.]|nr:hypothetical protein [Allosphingosinicella sp.]
MIRDPELQPALARLSLAALDRLLTLVPAGESLPAAELGALVRLIHQAAEYGAEPEQRQAA